MYFLMMKILFVLCIPSVILATLTHDDQFLPFPSDFKFGVSTSAFQVEGGWNINGKGLHIWDTITHRNSSFVKNSQNGDKACDSYHLWKKDVELLNNLGVHFYRFSISWSRLLPTGFSNYINTEAVEYYNNLINELLSYGIQPMITLYHGDLPEPLQDMGGWPNPLLITHFENYANTVFRLFGDRVKIWITFSDPYEICVSGYGTGEFAPGISSSGISDYLCGKTVLMAHAKAFRLYKRFYHKKQKGKIGMSVKAAWYEPKTNVQEDKQAAQRALEMTFGWWVNPIFSKSGDYPPLMKSRVKLMSHWQNFSTTRLSVLSKDEIKNIKGSADFLGINYYTSHITSNNTNSTHLTVSFDNDLNIKKEYNPEWTPSALVDLRNSPNGLRKLLKWIKDSYKNPEVYITENGFADHGEVNDTNRINYLRDHLVEVQKATVTDRCKVKGYSVWSLMDNFAWKYGYTIKFGLYSVNFTDPFRVRSPKASVEFYKNVIDAKAITPQEHK